MERYILHFVSHFMSSSDFRHRQLQDVEELCSACQICEQQLICAGLTLAFLLFLKELQIILLMLYSSWLQTGERFKTSFSETPLVKKKKKKVLH